MRYHRGGIQPIHDECSAAKDGNTCEYRKYSSHNQRLSYRQRQQLRLRSTGDSACFQQGQPQPEPKEKAGGHPYGRVQKHPELRINQTQHSITERFY